MARYSASNELAGTRQNMTSSYKTLLLLTAATATLTRSLLYDVTVGTNGVPADNALEFDISRTTTALGTGTTATANALDTTIRAGGTVATVNHTAEPTVTAASSLLQFGMNQRASYRWVAAPNSELVIPAVNLAGLAVRSKSAAYTSTVTAAGLFEE
jgi:hypothetical protein